LVWERCIGVLPGAVLYELNGGAFPGLKLTGNPADVVTGDIIEILDEATIQRMDRLEGHPSFYERVKQTVYMSQGLDLECWVYIYKHPVYQEDMIPSGDWKKRN